MAETLLLFFFERSQCWQHALRSMAMEHSGGVAGSGGEGLPGLLLQRIAHVAV